MNHPKIIKFSLKSNQSPGGSSPENGIRVHAALRPPFSCPPGHSLRPHFQNFSVPHGPTFTWNQNFFWKFAFKASKSGKNSVLKPKIWWKFSFKNLKLDKKQFFKTTNLVAVRSLSPYFRSFGLHTQTKMKVEYPPITNLLNWDGTMKPWYIAANSTPLSHHHYHHHMITF